MSKDIPGLILENNLYGIDIDKRCYQLTSFALTMKAREYYRRYLRNPVQPQVISLQIIPHDVIESSGHWSKDSLMWKFEDIDTIGSLLKVTPKEYSEIKVDSGVFGTDQKLLKTQAEYLSRSYDCVVTNPPYLGKGFGDALSEYLKKNYKDSKGDTYASFIERVSSWPVHNGYSALVTMESWMFLSTFEGLRKKILVDYTIINLSHFDWHIMHIAFGTVAFILNNHKPNNERGVYSYLSRKDVDLNIDKPYSFPLKDNGRYAEINQGQFLQIPGFSISYWISDKIRSILNNVTLLENSNSVKGLDTCDNDKFTRIWFEVGKEKIGFNINDTSQCYNHKWFPYCKGGGQRKWYGLNEIIVNWENDGEILRNLRDENGKIKSRPQNTRYYFKEGITFNSLSSAPPTFRYMKYSIFGGGGSGIFTLENLKYKIALVNTKLGKYILKSLNPTFNVLVSDILNIPFIYEDNNITTLTEEVLTISKEDWDAHETSWDFKINEIVNWALHNEGAQISPINPNEKFKRLSWIVNVYKIEWTEKFNQLHQNEEELNRKFIEIYGLQDELTPDVPLDEVTILQKGEISIKDNQIVWHEDEIIKQFLHYLVGVFMGRYSVDKPGLIIASQGQKIQDLDLPSQTIEIDDDAIIPIIMEPDFFADDLTKRIEDAIKTLFGRDGYYENLRYIENTLSMPLREWLFKNFYDKHLEMYSVKGAKRPIYWLFSSRMGDKKKKGHFKALVYMHRMESDTLSKLHADYVLPYQANVKRQLTEAEEQASRDDLSPQKHRQALAEVEYLKQKLREVKEFSEELAKMASRRMTIDLDDGVKTNYPKFYPLVESIKGLETSGE